MSLHRDCARELAIFPVPTFQTLKRRAAAQRIAAARRQGSGLYVQEWLIGGEPEPLEERVLGWCRETLAGARRPYGITHFELALAFGPGGGQPLQRLRIPRAEPAELYAEGSSLARQLREFFAEASRAATTAGPLLVAAALCSWGDLAYAAFAGS